MTGVPLALNSTQSGPTNNLTPVFQYYAYGTGGAINQTPLTVGSGGLTAAQAQTVAMVAINYRVLPTDNWNSLGRAADFNDTVVLRLTPASSAASASNLPCA